MFKPIRFPSEVENLVRFVEETEPDRIIEETLTKLRDGVSPKELLTAGALAVVRSTELPSSHHGGPVPPDMWSPWRISYVSPPLRRVGLHSHRASMWPYATITSTPAAGRRTSCPEIAPLDGKGDRLGSYHLGNSYHWYESVFDPKYGAVTEEEDKDSQSATKAAFQRSIEARESSSAEQHCLWLLENLPPGEVFDLLLPAAISRNSMDDHFFIYPMFTARALDCIGWEWASVLMRPMVRYQARNPFIEPVRESLDFSVVEGLLDKYRLLEIDIPDHTTDRETDAIGELSASIGACHDYADTIELMAKALGDGLSLEGTGEALSIGAATIYLSTSYGNPMDSHFHTGANVRRYLLKMEGVSRRNKIMALLTGITGPECVVGEGMMDWSPYTDSEALAALPERSQDELLEAIIEGIEDQPSADWREFNLDSLIARSEVKDTIALAQQYSRKGYDPMALFQRLGELICRDDFTELHGLKHHQAIFDEFYTTREPFRWVHLVSAAKSAAVVHAGREQTVYKHTRELLKV